MYPCLGCLRCSDGCRRRCRRRSSEHAVDVRHLRTGHGSMIQLNSNTQHHPLSVAIELEHAPVARSHMVDAFCKNERFSTLSVGFDRNASATSQRWWVGCSGEGGPAQSIVVLVQLSTRTARRTGSACCASARTASTRRPWPASGSCSRRSCPHPWSRTCRTGTLGCRGTPSRTPAGC